MMTDPIADMLTRIRNATRAGKEAVVVPFSKLKFRLAQVLAQEKYIAGVREETVNNKPYLHLALRYTPTGASVITSVARVSTPGRRVYCQKNELPRVLNHYGVAILSTPQGLMTNKEAKKRGLGGEIMCEIY